MQSKQKEMLRLSFDQIFKAKKYECLKKPILSSDPLIHTIGLYGMKARMNDDRYATLDEYAMDIHSVVDGYTRLLPSDDNLKKAADELWDVSDLHVKIIEACAECFERQMKDRKNYLTDACTIPHLLVHVHLEDFPIWPGKLISIDGDKAHILFFGDHNQADVELKDCFLYSEHFHSEKRKDRHLNLAIKEAKAHIQKIQEKFGPFYPADKEMVLTGYDSSSLNMELKSMFPGAFAEVTTPSNGTNESSSLNKSQEDGNNNAESDDRNQTMTEENVDDVDETADDDYEYAANVSLEHIVRSEGVERDFLDLSSSSSEPSSDEEPAEHEESSVQIGQKRKRLHQNGDENGARSHENLAKTTSFSQNKYAKLHRLEKDLTSKMREHRRIWQEIRHLQRQHIENFPTCSHCEIPLKGLFFCSDQCKHSFNESEDISNDE